MNLNQFIEQLAQLKQLMESQHRDCDTVNVLFKHNGKTVKSINPVDDGTGQDNLDVELA